MDVVVEELEEVLSWVLLLDSVIDLLGGSAVLILGGKEAERNVNTLTVSGSKEPDVSGV